MEFRDLTYPQTFDFTHLTTFKNVVIIRGVIEKAHIRIRADQIADVTTIDSDGTSFLDQVAIVGTNIVLQVQGKRNPPNADWRVFQGTF